MTASKEPKICIMGGGSWATALAKIVMENGSHINWYMRRQEQIDKFKETGFNPSYLSTIRFDIRKIKFYSNINQAVRYSDILLLAMPSPFLKMHLQKLSADISGKRVITAIKGIVPDENMVITDYLQQYYGVKE